MKRRNFIKIGAAGAAAIALGKPPLSRANNAVAAPGTGSAGPPKKGLMLGTFRHGDLSVAERFQLLKEAGFDGVEPGSGLNRDEVLRARDAAGLEIPSVVISTHWAQPLSHPDPVVRASGLAGLTNGLQDAKAYGADTVLLVPGIVNSEISYEEAYRRSQREIRKAIPLAEDLGVTIAIENVWNHFLLSPLEACRYVDEFESPRVGWYFDVGNIMNYGWPDQWVRILGTRIKKVHIKEYSRAERDKTGPYSGFRVNLLEGDNQWAAIMEAFRAVGYHGYFIAEPPHRDPDLTHAEWLKDYIAGRMDTIFASAPG